MCVSVCELWVNESDSSPREAIEGKLNREEPEDGEKEEAQGRRPGNDEETTRQLVGKKETLCIHL